MAPNEPRLSVKNQTQRKFSVDCLARSRVVQPGKKKRISKDLQDDLWREEATAVDSSNRRRPVISISVIERCVTCTEAVHVLRTWTKREYRQMQITRMTISVRRPDDLLAGGPICGCFVQLPVISHYHRLPQRLLRRAFSFLQVRPGTVSIASNQILARIVWRT